MTNHHRRRLSLRLEQGQTATEYAVLLAFLVIAALAAIPFFGSSVGGLFTSIVTEIGSVTGQ